METDNKKIEEIRTEILGLEISAINGQFNRDDCIENMNNNGLSYLVQHINVDSRIEEIPDKLDLFLI